MTSAGREESDARLKALRAAYVDARDALYVAVIGACPGKHRSVQYRDGKPPWCKACGRDDYAREWADK